MRCPACAGETPDGRRFCKDCGAPLASLCPSCGAELVEDSQFCVDCGAPIGTAGRTPAGTAPTTTRPGVPAGTAGPGAPARSPARSGVPGRSSDSPAGSRGAPGGELRHVSVLFCDLVGYTSLSEDKEPEDMRELLSGYFDLARAIITRYGGTIEKFIGDAVMALWGAPVANEDDAERAVRAGLELVSAVAGYGSDRGVELRARTGVVTGTAATTEAAEEGLVIGDTVNTASRVQSAAPAGCCYVDETTRAATSAAIAFEDAGTHELKGKAEPLHLYRAARVTAAIAGSQRVGVIEAPFVGRDHELRLLKEHFHHSADRSSARLVLVTGVAGIGKSRLSWEFFKYLDGLATEMLWHSGRCLSYGEGISFFALKEMVRARLGIGEDDPAPAVRDRLGAGLERWIEDPADRAYIHPRLAQLLGLGEESLMREELYAGWRLFFERLSDHLPVVMVLEDLQWADTGLLEFLDLVLDWSADHPIFVLALSRPDVTDRGKLVLTRRNVTTVLLEPLSDDHMAELLAGLVPDLPKAPLERVIAHAEGVPLYAVETVRALLDKGVLTRDPAGVIHLEGEIGVLETPPGLTALISSRLDGLEPAERQVTKECSVLGDSFPRSSLEAVSDLDPDTLDKVLRSLVRKEVLSVRADKLSPERGQYAFTQLLIRSVAYEMLTRAERKARHVKTAAHLRAAFPEDGSEVIELIAAHLHDAYRAAGQDPDSGELRIMAKDAYVAAGERAESLGTLEEAEAAYLTAVELSDDEQERALLHEKAGLAAGDAGFTERAIEHLSSSVESHRSKGRVVEAARVSGELGRMLYVRGRRDEAFELVAEAISSLDEERAPPTVLARLKADLATYLSYAARASEAAEALEEALRLAQRFEEFDALAIALDGKAHILETEGRLEEVRLCLEGAAAVAGRHSTRDQPRIWNNLAWFYATHDLKGAEERAIEALDLVRRRGRRSEEAVLADTLMLPLRLAGRLEEAERVGDDVLGSVTSEVEDSPAICCQLALIAAMRGRTDKAREHLERATALESSSDPQLRAIFAMGRSIVELEEGDPRAALDAALRAIGDGLASSGPAADTVRECIPIAVDAALALGEPGEVEPIIAEL
ncbi:MAG: AAA family ATPase, partial [Acidimicrobiales bacterium]